MSELKSMPTSLDFDAFTETLYAAGVRTETLAMDEKGTLQAPIESSFSLDSVDHLPVIMGEGMQEFKVKGRLGAGGMGTIHLAQQSALRRDVAVKQAIKRERQDLTGALLAEGIVTGQLEHPNVVPMYALGRNAEGDVLLVMKRIEGTVWEDLLKEYPPTGDVHLERHLRILIDVAEAIAFAHTKGIIHRDLKPQNIMVGSFGEVYVLDWGLALGFGEQAPHGAMTQDDLTGISGTPAYMAPEMTMPTERMDHRTDIYLLGAVLFELLTGEPPHKRMDVMRGLYEAFLSRVSIPDHVPLEIREVCLKALKRSPGDRYQDVRSFIDAVQAFLHHAAARELEKEGHHRLEEFLRLDKEDLREAQAEKRVQRAYIESQFAFSQALKLWDQSVGAKAGLRRGSEAMAWHEVRRERPDSARVFIAQIANPSPELVEAIAELSRKKKEKAEELKSIRAALFEENSDVGRRSRAWFFVGVGCIWMFSQIIAGEVARRGFYTNTAENRTYPSVLSGDGLTLLEAKATLPQPSQRFDHVVIFGHALRAGALLGGGHADDDRVCAGGRALTCPSDGLGFDRGNARADIGAERNRLNTRMSRRVLAELRLGAQRYFCARRHRVICLGTHPKTKCAAVEEPLNA